MRLKTSCKLACFLRATAGLGLIGLGGQAEEITTFEIPAVAGTPVPLPSWSGFGPVVLQYGSGVVQDTLAGEGAQALRMGPGDALAASAVAWSPRTEAAGGARAVTSLLVRHDSFSEASPVIPSEELSAVLFINNTGLLALDGDGRGKGSWKILHPLTPGTFHKVSVIRDYAAQSFQVELDGKQVGDNLGFKDPLTGSPLLATCETSGEIWLDHLSTTFRSDQTPPSPNPAGWEVPPAPGTATGEVKDALATDFTGRIVSGNTARNISWSTNGLADPGDLTAIDVNNTGRLDGLFTSSAAVDRFLPNLNLLNEGPWQTTLPLVPTEPSLVLQDVVLEIQHLGNRGTIPIIDKRGQLTVSVSGSISGLLGSITIPHLVAANDGSGTDTFTFDPPLTLDERESYALTILAEERGSGANVGFESLRIRQRCPGIVDTDHSVRMLAREARDLSGVDYYFECLSGGGHDSGWQSSPEYVDTGLSPGTRYQYRTRSRDRSSSLNLSAWSPPAAAKTTGNPPSGSFAAWIASFGLAPGEQDFQDDPDGDRLSNGIEAWFGSDPHKPNAGLVKSSSDGLISTLTHPTPEVPLTNLVGSYQWSPDLLDWYDGDGIDGPGDGTTVAISAISLGNLSTVTIIASQRRPRLYFRVAVVQD